MTFLFPDAFELILWKDSPHPHAPPSPANKLGLRPKAPTTKNSPTNEDILHPLFTPSSTASHLIKMKTLSFSHLMVPALLIAGGSLTGSGLTWVTSLRRKENADSSGIYNTTAAMAKGWSRRAPEQAAAWFTESGSTSQRLLAAVVGTWARQDSVAALPWAAALADPSQRTTSLNSVLGEMARLDPLAAVRVAEPYLQSAGQAGASGEAVAGRDVARTLADI